MVISIIMQHFYAFIHTYLVIRISYFGVHFLPTSLFGLFSFLPGEKLFECDKCDQFFRQKHLLKAFTTRPTICIVGRARRPTSVESATRPHLPSRHSWPGITRWGCCCCCFCCCWRCPDFSHVLFLVLFLHRSCTSYFQVLLSLGEQSDDQIDWLTDWLTDWLIDWLIDWLTDWLFDWLTDWLFDWLTDWLFDWLTDWLIDWLIDLLTGRLIDRDRLIDGLVFAGAGNLKSF